MKFKTTLAGMAAVAGAFAAQPAAAAACDIGPYMVFFEPNKPVLSPQAKAIFEAAAKAYAICGASTIYVAGHTDTRGTPADNVTLSMRQAKAVQTFLIAQGLPSKKIELSAFGETRLLVETADGVSEPQNRRVEIMFEPKNDAW
jgi:outer membrane protein OmpA-like peptidoglycan-associated protein